MQRLCDGACVLRELALDKLASHPLNVTYYLSHANETAILVPCLGRTTMMGARATLWSAESRCTLLRLIFAPSLCYTGRHGTGFGADELPVQSNTKRSTPVLELSAASQFHRSISLSTSDVIHKGMCFPRRQARAHSLTRPLPATHVNTLQPWTSHSHPSS